MNPRRQLRLSVLGMTALLLAASSGLGCDSAAASDAPIEQKPVPRIARTMAKLGTLCDGAEPFDGMKATPKGELKRVATFVKYTTNAKPRWSAQSPKMLDVWKSESMADVGLVACVERRRLEKANTCRFSNGRVLNYHHTADHVRLIEPSTGKVVAEKKVQLESRTGCPSAYSFKHKTEWTGPSYASTVMSLAMPLQPEDPPMPDPPKAYAMYQVCGGIPFPQIAAYDPKATHYQGIAFGKRGPEAPGSFVGRIGEEGENVRLVACLKSKAIKKKRSCRFMGGNVLEIHDGEVEVEIRESRTAKVIAKKTFAAKGTTRCPTIHDFAKGSIKLGGVAPAFKTFVEGFTGKAPKREKVSKSTSDRTIRR